MNATTSYNIVTDTDFLAPKLENIPDELKQYHQWVCWKTVTRDGKVTKVPINAKTGMLASSTDHTTWCDYETAVKFYQMGEALEGIGFVFTADDPFCGIDLDKCRDQEQLTPLATKFLDVLNSYCEISPSGKGVKAIIKAKKPGDKCKNVKLNTEVYDHNRFFTLTGHRINTFPADIQTRQKQVEAIYHAWFPEQERKVTDHTPQPNNVDDDDLIRLAKESNDDLFQSLWDYDTQVLKLSGKYTRNDGTLDHSSLDLALCCKLAFWTGRDKQRMDELFRKSGLYRDKWERQSYSDATLERAIERCEEVYRGIEPTADQLEQLKKMSCEGFPNPKLNDDLDIFAADFVTAPDGTSDHTAKMDHKPQRWLDIFSTDFLQGENREPLIQDFINRSELMVLAAPSKSGKLLVMQWMIQSILYQESFLGGDPIAPCPIAYLDFENNRGYFLDWYKALLRGRDSSITSKFLLYSSKQGLPDGSGRLPNCLSVNWLKEHIKEIQASGLSKPGLIVVDTFRAAHYLTPGIDPKFENDHGTVGKILRPIQELCHASGWSCVMLHHTNKAKDISGSTDFWASADCVCRFDRDIDSNSNECVFRLDGRFNKTIPTRVALFNGHNRFEYVGEWDKWLEGREEKKRRMDAERQITDFVMGISRVVLGHYQKTYSLHDLITHAKEIAGIGQNKARALVGALVECKVLSFTVGDKNKHIYKVAGPWEQMMTLLHQQMKELVCVVL